MLPRLSPRRKRTGQGKHPLQLWLPMLAPEEDCGKPADMGQLFRIVWELASSEARADGLIVRSLRGDFSPIERTKPGFHLTRDCAPVDIAMRWTSRTGRPVLLSRGMFPAQATEQQLKQSGLSSIAGFPLIGNGQKLGVAVALKAASRTPFDADQLELLRVLCQQVAVALGRIQLVKEVKKLKGAVEWLTTHYLDAQERERRQLCLDLHDGVVQWMMAAKQQIQTFDLDFQAAPETARKVEEVEHMLSQSIGELRSLMADLQPPQVEERGLPLVLLRMMSTLSRITRVHTHFRIRGNVQAPPPNVQLVIYRIVQESLNNVRKHAGAKDVTVILDYANAELTLMVKDNGCGFDVPKTLASGQNDETLGLTGMRERTEALGGTFDVCSSPGAGTTVSAILPLTLAAISPLSAEVGFHEDPVRV